MAKASVRARERALRPQRGERCPRGRGGVTRGRDWERETREAARRAYLRPRSFRARPRPFPPRTSSLSQRRSSPSSAISHRSANINVSGERFITSAKGFCGVTVLGTVHGGEQPQQTVGGVNRFGRTIVARPSLRPAYTGGAENEAEQLDLAYLVPGSLSRAVWWPDSWYESVPKSPRDIRRGQCVEFARGGGER